CSFWDVCQNGSSCPHIIHFDDKTYAEYCSVYRRSQRHAQEEIQTEEWVKLSRNNTIKSMQCSLASLQKKLQSYLLHQLITHVELIDDLLCVTISSKTIRHNVSPDIQEEELEEEVELRCPVSPPFTVGYFIQCLDQMHRSLSPYLYNIQGWRKVPMVRIEEGMWSVRVSKEVFSLAPRVAPVLASPPKSLLAGEDHLLVIDGSSLLTRGYYATERTAELKTSSGLHTNAVYVMVRMLFQLLRDFRPTHVAIGWDVSRQNTWRKKRYDAYKANRSEKPPALKEQFGTAQKLFQEMGIYQYSHPEFEADDVIGTLVHRWKQEIKSQVSMISGDKDLLQLLDHHVRLYLPKKGVEEMDVYSMDRLKEFEFTHPRQFLELKGIMGDTSDNLPGVKGIGEKRAYPLIQQYHTLENIYEHLQDIAQDRQLKSTAPRLELGREDAFLSRDLATIRHDVPGLEGVQWDRMIRKVNRVAMYEAFERLEFKQLIQEIREGKYRAS
uniref:5'-3' exonuclease n=1 Tax=Mycobacteroides abscessus TaxID=36809 RepID=UPI001A7E10A9